MNSSGSQPADTEPTVALTAHYAPLPHRFDTWVGADGRGGEVWKRLAPRLNLLGSSELTARQERLSTIVEESSLSPPEDVRTRDGSEHVRSVLDVLPFALHKSEFEILARGVEERAQLFNRLVADLLGEQRVLREGILPPELLFTNPFYYRAYQTLKVEDDRYLHLYGLDVALASNGSWWAVRDLTRSPTGLGRILEHRLAASRVHSDWFHSMHVERLLPGLTAFRETLAELAPRNRRNPRIVLLSGDPATPEGLEDEFLARYLGYSLVVSNDIATRQGQTVLKTLGGVQPIDVIVRRIDDEACDPVELASDRLEGVAGLVESQKRGEVSLANVLGTRLVEAPAIGAFLGPIARLLLDKEIELPTVATWWCGQEAALAEVLSRLDDLVITSAFDATEPPLDVRALSGDERAQLIERLKAKPELYAARERIESATTPSWNGERLEPREFTLRLFGVADGEVHRTLPSGLVRLQGPDPESSLVSEPEVSRPEVQDFWVLSDSFIVSPSLKPLAEDQLPVHRSHAELSSRVAENLYWLGRRLEAAENRARLLRGLLERLYDEAPEPTPRAEGDHDQTEKGSLATEEYPWLVYFESLTGSLPTDLKQAETAILDFAFRAPEEGGSPQGLPALLTDGLRLARSVRDRVSADAWRVVARNERRVKRLAGSSPKRRSAVEVAQLLDEIILDASGFSGLMSESMTRALAWRFLDMGRRVERALHAADLIDSGLVVQRPRERSTLELLLEICDSTMTYRSRYLADLRTKPVLDLLVTDETNPRSLAFQLQRLDAHLGSLPREEPLGILDVDQRASLTLLSAVRLADPDALTTPNISGERKALKELVETVRVQLPIVERALTARYLVHAQLPKQFTAIPVEAAAPGRETAEASGERQSISDDSGGAP